MAQNIFGSSRRKLTLLYSIVMIIFLVVLIFAMHKTMEWSITSEQARELMDTASNVAEAQEYFNQHPEIVLDDTIAYKSTNDRLFFYVFDNEGRLLNFARASFRIEPFILDTIAQEKVEPGGVTVFSKPGSENTRKARIMLTAQQVRDDEGNATQTVYVGKDVTAMYNGMEKATYALAFLGAIALVIATIVGHVLSGKAMIPLRQAYEKQRQFAADASHELRTPLAVVMASAELLQNDPSIKSPFLRQVIDDVRHAVALVEDHGQELDGRLGRQARRFYQGLGLAADVRDGSLQPVSDVGYELFPQRLVLHLLRNVVDHDQDAHLLFLVEGGH